MSNFLQKLNITDYNLIVINDNVLTKLYSLLGKLIEAGAKRVEIEIGKGVVEQTPFEDIVKIISDMRYSFLGRLLVRIKNIPFCIVEQPESFTYSKGKAKEFIRIDQCNQCKFRARCLGIARQYVNYISVSLIKPILDLPKEVMIEIEEKCNLNCDFCFNKNSFAKNGRDIINRLTNVFTKKIVDAVVEANIPAIRFTGGEPLLRGDIWELALFAKKKGLEVRLNTNGVLINSASLAKKIAAYFDNILIPLQYTEILKKDNIFNAKIKAIKLLQQTSVKVLRVDTVATSETIRNLNKVCNFITKFLAVKKWELNRIIATSRCAKDNTEIDMKNLIEKLLIIKGRTGKTHYIVNAIPFCSYNPTKVQAVAIGAEACDGHERIAVDPRGFAKPIYYMEKNIGDPIDILACWNHPFMKRMRNLEYAPKECRNCVYLEKCRGGCRFSAKTLYGSFSAKDPLANFRNKVI